MANDGARCFDDAEYQRRRERVRASMSERGLDACIVASPENIYYLTGLDHMGYFASQLLLFPLKGEPVLITRAMESATVRDQVPDCVHLGYSDGTKPPPVSSDTGPAIDEPWSVTAGAPTREISPGHPDKPSPAAARKAVKALHDLGLAESTLAVDHSSNFLPHAIADAIITKTPKANWEEIGNLIDDLRIEQSPAELEYTREAARVSDAMMMSAIASAGEGINAREIMAAIYDSLFRRGGTYPGFVPLVRSTRNLEHEHGTWENRALEAGDLLFLEMSGCVRRYHAPTGRLTFIDESPSEAQRINEICQEAMYAAADTIGDGVAAGDVYENWHAALDRAGLSHYSRHHCGYAVGIGYPPSWSGSGVPVGLRPGSDMKLRSGMVFHLMSWLLRSGLGDSFLSDTIVVTDEGCEFLTTVDRGVTIRR